MILNTIGTWRINKTCIQACWQVRMKTSPFINLTCNANKQTLHISKILLLLLLLLLLMIIMNSLKRTNCRHILNCCKSTVEIKENVLNSSAVHVLMCWGRLCINHFHAWTWLVRVGNHKQDISASPLLCGKDHCVPCVS